MKAKVLFTVSMVVALSISFCACGDDDDNDNKPSQRVETISANGISIQMVAVEGGVFQMGSETGESDEKPVHEVKLSNFFIGQTEVTQELWEAVMGKNPSSSKGAKRPVESVSWNRIQSFIETLNQMTGKTFRLPTEAEWEFAARGGTKSKGYTYAGSNTLSDVAYSSNEGTYDVATLPPNELGIYDMSGNVSEYCQDYYDKDFYSKSVVNNPICKSGRGRVIRGGDYEDASAKCRVTSRSRNEDTETWLDSGFRTLGFRLVLSE